MEHEGEAVVDALQTFLREGTGNQWKNRNHPDYIITEKNPGNLRRLAVTLNPVKDLQLMLRRKSRKEYPKSVLGNETHKLLRDFDVQTVHLISARRPNKVLINKKEENL